MSDPKPGPVKVIIKEAALCTSGSGTGYIGFLCECFDAEGESVGEFDNRSFTSPACLDKTNKRLDAIGFDPDKVAADGTITGVPTTPFDGALKMEEYQGVTRLKLDWIIVPPYGASINSKDRLTKAQADMMLAELKAARGTPL